MQISEKSKKEIESLFFKNGILKNNGASFLICKALYSSSCERKNLIKNMDGNNGADVVRDRLRRLKNKKFIQSTDGLLELTDIGRWIYVASVLGLRISSLFLLSHVYVTQKKLEKIGCEGFCPFAQFRDLVQYSHNLIEIIRNLRESGFIYRYGKRCVRMYPDKMQILEKYDYELDSLNKYLLGLRSDIEDIVNHDEIVDANFKRNCKLFVKIQENPKVITQ